MVRGDARCEYVIGAAMFPPPHYGLWPRSRSHCPERRANPSRLPPDFDGIVARCASSQRRRSGDLGLRERRRAPAGCQPTRSKGGGLQGRAEGCGRGRDAAGCDPALPVLSVQQLLAEAAGPRQRSISLGEASAERVAVGHPPFQSRLGRCDVQRAVWKPTTPR